MKIHELLSDKSKWTTAAFARDSSGVALASGKKESAVCWCLIGAAQKCYGFNPSFELMLLLQNAPETNGLVYSFNDNSTYEQVYALVKRLDI